MQASLFPAPPPPPKKQRTYYLSNWVPYGTCKGMSFKEAIESAPTYMQHFIETTQLQLCPAIRQHLNTILHLYK